MLLDEAILNQYEGLIFDMDGTVIDTMPAHAYAWDLVGQELGYDFDSQLMYQLGGAPVKVIAQAIMQKASMPLTYLDKVIETKRRISYEIVPARATLLPAFDIVTAFYGKKPTAIGSGSHQVMVDRLMAKLNIAHYFNAIVSADQVKEHKPHPETFLRCAELLQATPQHCLVFEDADLGVQAGLAAGMDVFDVRTNTLIKG